MVFHACEGVRPGASVPDLEVATRVHGETKPAEIPKGRVLIWPWLFNPNTWGPPKGSLWPRTLQDDRPPE
jgi:hypothetical protein